jgi:hypothetical protein
VADDPLEDPAVQEPASAIFSSCETSTWMAASFERHPRYALTTPSINKRKMKEG